MSVAAPTKRPEIRTELPGPAALEIIKAGFEEYVAEAARNHGFLYGLAAVALALLTGWFASVVLRRD